MDGIAMARDPKQEPGGLKRSGGKSHARGGAGGDRDRRDRSTAPHGRLQPEALRAAHYNATLIGFERLHDELAILRVRPDAPLPRFEPGQYNVLGLGYWEPRVADCQPEELDDRQLRSLIKRAYSISCPMLDAKGKLWPVNECGFLEIYVALIRFVHPDHPPALTPRLFALSPGDRLYVGEHFKGHYTLRGIRPTDNLVFVATGTGEAPHNAMLTELLARGHQGQIASLTCVRYRADLGYLAKHRELERRYANYRYHPLTMREPENLNPEAPGYVGKVYVQHLFESGGVGEVLGAPLDPQNTHVFLCGNPAMIGAPHRGPQGERVYPQPKGMVEVLETMGFATDQPKRPGNVHFEKYW